MSTWLYLECADHDPPITADEESGQHLYDLTNIRADLRNRELIVANTKNGDWPTDYYRVHTARFLAQHPKCRIVIRDEYDNLHRTGETEPSA